MKSFKLKGLILVEVVETVVALSEAAAALYLMEQK